MISLGFRENDTYQEFFSDEEALSFRNKGFYDELDDILHALDKYLSDAEISHTFYSNQYAIYMKVITNWLNTHGVIVE